MEVAMNLLRGNPDDRSLLEEFKASEDVRKSKKNAHTILRTTIRKFFPGKSLKTRIKAFIAANKEEKSRLLARAKDGLRTKKAEIRKVTKLLAASKKAAKDDKAASEEIARQIAELMAKNDKKLLSKAQWESTAKDLEQRLQSCETNCDSYEDRVKGYTDVLEAEEKGLFTFASKSVNHARTETKVFTAEDIEALDKPQALLVKGVLLTQAMDCHPVNQDKTFNLNLDYNHSGKLEDIKKEIADMLDINVSAKRSLYDMLASDEETEDGDDGPPAKKSKTANTLDLDALLAIDVDTFNEERNAASGATEEGADGNVEVDA